MLIVNFLHSIIFLVVQIFMRREFIRQNFISKILLDNGLNEMIFHQRNIFNYYFLFRTI